MLKNLLNFDNIKLITEIAKEDAFFRAKAKLITRNGACADDIVQDMYVRLIRYYNEPKMQELHDKGILKYSCVRIMKQCYLNILKKNEKEVLVDCFSYFQANNSKPIGVEIMDIINELYWFDAKLLDMYGNKGETIRSIAKKTGIPSRTIWNRLRIAKEKVKTKYNQL